MISVVVPRIVKIYLTMKVQLPLSTRAVIWLSNSFIEHKVFFAVLLIVIFWLMYVLRAKYKNVYDLVKVKLPIFGTVFLNSSLQRFFETLFILLHSGIPLVQSLDIAKATLDNKYLEVIVSDIKDKVEKGSSLYDSIRNSGKEIFPNISLQLIKAGENSGNLEQSLQKLSDIFEEEIENFSKYLTSILEPITIVLVGTIIGFIVFSLLLPIAQISTLR
jgi:type II secretory pathway component PulF